MTGMSRLIDEPLGTDRPQDWQPKPRYPSQPDPLPQPGTSWLDRWEHAAHLVTFLPDSPQAAIARKWLDGLWDHLDDLWPAPAKAPARLPVRHPKHSVPVAPAREGEKPRRPEMLSAPAEDVTSVPALGEVVSSGDRRGLSVAREALAGPEVTHLQPGGGQLVLPCCGMSLFDLPDGSVTTSELPLVTCGRPVRPSPAAVTEQWGDGGPAGQKALSCPAGECNGYGEVEVGHHTCGAGAYGDGGRHEPGCGYVPCPAGCAYVPFADRPKSSPVAAEVPVKPAEVPANAALLPDGQVRALPEPDPESE